MKEYQLPEKIVVGQIMQILKQIKQRVATDIHGVTFDLAMVKSIDSAGIAFLIYLKTKYKNSTFLHLSMPIDNLCQLYKIQL